KVTEAEEIETKFVRALKKGIVQRRLDRDAIADAVEAGVLTGEEAEILRRADEATDRVIRVDDFAPDELARVVAEPGGARPARANPAGSGPATSRKSPARKGAPAKGRRKPASRDAAE